MNRLFRLLRSFFSIAEPYHPSDSKNAEKFFEMESIATVCYKICPRQVGQVEYRGRFWSARCFDDLILLPRTQVKVIDQIELTLIVEPLSASQAGALRPKKRFEQEDRLG
ncbi:MAG TPA: NfeD family protein [Leptolyngbya sp.]|nr:NfeD family protein [Leptolyngbya sp.]